MSYLARAKQHSSSRVVNMFVQKVFPDEELVLYSTPGLKLEVTNTQAKARGIHTKYEYLYVVLDSGFYKVDVNGTKTLLGTLNTSVGRVNIVSTNYQIVMNDLAYGYYYNIPTATFSTITDADFPATSATLVAFKERIYAHNNNTFLYSALSNASSWSAASVYTAETIQQDITALYSFDEKMYVFGSTQTEIWQPNDNTDDPLSSITSLNIRYGTESPYSIADTQDGLLFLGRGKRGKHAVIKINENFQTEAVGDKGFTSILSGYTSSEDATAYTLQYDNKEFYTINWTAANHTWHFDTELGIWTELEYNNKDRHPADQHVYFDGKNIVISYLDSNIYSLDNETYTDNSVTIVRKLISPVLQKDYLQVFLSQLIVKFEPTTTLHTGTGSEPSVNLSFSKDGGYSWSATRYKRIGKVGEYRYKTRFTNVAAGDDLVTNLQFHDPIGWALLGCYVNLEYGEA